jgi:hypothetical protein
MTTGRDRAVCGVSAAGHVDATEALMTTPQDQRPATPEQLQELRALASATGEEIPDGMLAVEAEQRLVELKAAAASRD